ncbi:hypothetical protein AB0I28_05975 [Phytomonospora sp. NPDC050363]|uniref:hypothetical protein n=1 Tax=Phytomonospora sp. NPDC050363 TaxID=3155642 RepID=UPI0033CE2544
MPGLLENLGLRYGWPEEYPALGFDPAPGRCEQVAALAGVLSAAAGDAGGLAARCAAAAGTSDGWHGEAGDAFRGAMAAARSKLLLVESALVRARAALSGWAADLSGMQNRARVHERDAAEAQRAVADALSAVDGAKTVAAQGAYEKAVAAARRLSVQHEALADGVAAALRAVVASAPVAGEIADLIQDAPIPGGDRTGSIFSRNADSLANLGDVLSDIGTFAGLTALSLAGLAGGAALTGGGVPAAVALTPGIVIAGQVGTVTAIGAAALHTLGKVGGGDVSWTDLLWDGFGIVSLGLGGGVDEVADQFIAAPATVRAAWGQREDTESHWDDYWQPRTFEQQDHVDTAGFVGRLGYVFSNAWDQGEVEYGDALLDAVMKETP